MENPTKLFKYTGWLSGLTLTVTLACQQPTDNQTEAPPAPASTQAAAGTTSLKSDLRPGEPLKLGKVYTDTVTFVDFNDDGDYFLFNVEKAQDTVWLIYQDEHNFVRGDRLAIQWEMDSMYFAGDPEELDFTERLVSASLLEPLKLENRTVKFLWREDRFNEEFNTTINTIVLDESYAKTITDPEKAALGYVATFIGNECSWDGKATSSRSNLKCKILTALNLGYQCSNTHLGFLRHWFRNDSAVLKKLENCPTIPDGATMQETFDSIGLTVSGDEIVVAYTVTGVNMQRGKSWVWNAKEYFVYRDNRLQLVKSEKSEPEVEDFEMQEN
ncbi:hypothetical protein [Parapedobacter tibetensis]|uniref:hypothetical protein n=1 Tax=Parapedobacter tibetensis TaxID=2972951 RepID=UPI00214DACDA|nr:hypothetical protein [Parapedobacter tibetensis]